MQEMRDMVYKNDAGLRKLAETHVKIEIAYNLATAKGNVDAYYDQKVIKDFGPQDVINILEEAAQDLRERYTRQIQEGL